MKPKRLSKSTWKPSKLPWWKLRLKRTGSIGAGYTGSPDLRLWMLAVSRVGGWGHAVFEPGELLSLLAKVTKSTGEVGTYTERNLQKVISTLAETGLLAPASNSRCLVIPIEILDSHLNSSRVSCPEHRVKHVWSTDLGGWVAVNGDGSLDLAELAQHLESVAS